MTTQFFPVKFVEGTDDTLRILGVPYGGPFIGPDGKGSDLDGERFTKNTDLCLKWFPNDRPLLFDHGHDATVEVDPVGRFESKSITQAEDGWWLNAQLDKSNHYFSAITDLVNNGKLFASSGAMGHLVKVDNKGNIERWPLVEVSLTPTPSNLLAQVGFGTVVKHYKSAGIELDVLEEADKVLSGAKAVLDSLALAEASDDDELKASAKTLMESVDTAGGFLVPEQVADKAVEKKPAKPASSDGDETDDDEDEKKKNATIKEVFDYLYEHPDEASKFLAERGEQKAAEDLEKIDYSDVLAFIKGDRLLLLAPTEQKATAAKDNEVVVAGSRYYGDPPEGSVEDWLSDLCNLLNRGMFSPFGYAGYTQLLATFGFNGPGYAIVCTYSYDDDDDEHYYRVAFDADANGEPVLGAVTPYASVYLPADQLPATTVGDDDDDMGKSVVPLLMHGAFLNKAAKVYLTRTKDVNDRRIEEGRVLSPANREQITKFRELSKAIDETFRALSDSVVPQAKANLDRLRQEVEVMEIEHQLLLQGAN